MIYTIDTLRQKIYENVYAVYDIFKNHFGEEFVDLQNLYTDPGLLRSVGVTEENIDTTDISDTVVNSVIDRIANDSFSDLPFVMVYWPSVRVTNENNKSIIIYELYAKITINIRGQIPYESHGFYLNRARYPLEQWIYSRGYGYMHSHVPGINKRDLTYFEYPCLGRGPINGTISTLKGDFDETIWMLFCEELGRYVTVESISGGPYINLEYVGGSNLVPQHQDFGSIYNNYSNERTTWSSKLGATALNDFIKYYLENGHLKISYKDGHFVCGMSYYDFIVDISNAFISFFNQYYKSTQSKISQLFNCGLISRVKVSNGKFYSNDALSYDRADLESYRGRHICTFKGRDITLQIDEDNVDQGTITILLKHDSAMYILSNILRVINYRYRNGRKQHTEGEGSQETSPTYKEVRYL